MVADVTQAKPSHTQREPLNPHALVLGPLTLGGAVAFFSGLLVFASGFESLRPNIGGLLLQPCMLPLMVVFPFVFFSRIGRFPNRILVSLMIFAAMYCFSVFASDVAWGEIAKCISAVLIIVASALLIRTRTDFVAGVVGLVIGVGILAIRGLQSEDLDSYGINPMDVANKNSFSIYALPAILLAGAVVLHMRNLSWLVKFVLVLFGVASIVSVMLSGNRSGWLGVAVVGLMLMKDRKLAGILLVVVLSAAAAFWISNYGNTKTVEQRIKDTQEGRTADNLRVRLFRNSFAIALENPILGVSPRQLPFELGRRLERHGVDPHNVFGHVAGGSGLICFTALMATGWSIWKWPMPKGVAKLPVATGYRAAIRIMHALLIVWVVRGMFTREILYNPSTCIGLGLVIGWCVTEQMLLKQSMEPADKRRYQLVPA